MAWQAWVAKKSLRYWQVIITGNYRLSPGVGQRGTSAFDCHPQASASSWPGSSAPLHQDADYVVWHLVARLVARRCTECRVYTEHACRHCAGCRMNDKHARRVHFLHVCDLASSFTCLAIVGAPSSTYAHQLRTLNVVSITRLATRPTRS